jgi:hypothetical protein
MSSIIHNDNAPISITESTRELTSNYGVAGTGPFLQDYSARLNVLLKDAIKARWDTDVSTPTASKILFLNTWVTGTRDYELIFRESYEDKPAYGRTTDWRLQQHANTVDVHIFVRGKGGDVEPPALGQIIRGLDKIVAVHCTTLIDNAVCEVVSIQPGPTEKLDDRATVWHQLMKIRIWYWKVKTV